jgi:hypothetical protein
VSALIAAALLPGADGTARLRLPARLGKLPVGRHPVTLPKAADTPVAYAEVRDNRQVRRMRRRLGR